VRALAPSEVPVRSNVARSSCLGSVLSLMKFAAPRSFVCTQAGNLPGRSPPPCLAVSDLPGGFFAACRPSIFSDRVHPSSSFPSPSAYAFARLLSVPSGLWSFDHHPVGRRAPPLGFPPSSRPQSRPAMTWVPMPHITVFPGSPRLGPALSDSPPLAFRTPSTVFSVLDLASLFHPAATFRFSPSGVCPSLRIGSGSLRPFPLLSLGRRACGLTRAGSIFRRLQGFSPRCEFGDQRGG